MFEPQHGTSSEGERGWNMARDPPELVASKADCDETTQSRLGNLAKVTSDPTSGVVSTRRACTIYSEKKEAIHDHDMCI